MLLRPLGERKRGEAFLVVLRGSFFQAWSLFLGFRSELVVLWVPIDVFLFLFFVLLVVLSGRQKEPLF